MTPEQYTPESSTALPKTSATSASSSLPSSQSNGSLQNLATATSTNRPLVNRTSNPIITAEDDEENINLSQHLKADIREQSRRLTASLAEAGMGAAAAAVMNGDVKSAPSRDQVNLAQTESVEMVSMNGAANVQDNDNSATAVGTNQKKISPLSSRVSVDSASQQSTQGPWYTPPTLQTTDSNSNTLITPNNTAVSNTPTSSIPSANTSPNSAAPSNVSFDFDATQHNQKKGTGYLASQTSLSTPTDVFASGCTLLQLCAIGNLQAVKEYVTKSCNNVNFRDYDRRTALHVASSEGHLDVVKFLVVKGAHVNKSDRWGGSPLDDAHRHRHTDVARYLRSKGGQTGSLNQTTNLIAAAAAGDMEEVTMICADVGNMSQVALDLSDSRSRAAVKQNTILDLSLSRSRGRVAQAKKDSLGVSEPTLERIKNAVDINKGDYDQRTALHLAAGEGHLDVVKYLCKRGANVNVEDRWGGRPLDDALQKGHDTVAGILRQYGAKTGQEENGMVPVHRGSRVDGSLSVSNSHHEQEDENLRVEFSELEMIERIGSGAFGEIYKCRWRGILVAAKCIKASKIQKEWLLKNRTGLKKEDHIKNRIEAIRQTTITEEEKQLALEDFRRETAIMRRLRHPNIVMMLAYSHSDDVEVMISEICRCSLLDIFKANSISNSQIPKRTQIAYAQQLAQGMNHLHKSRPPIIHRDLKPANLLIDFNGTLKIADFGLAKIRPNPEQNEDEAFLMTGETGSYRFMAPEVFRHEEYTQTVDVYSYAMIFYYMIRGSPPWSGLSGLDAVTKAAVDGERPLIPRNVDARISTLLNRCWDESARARPSFEEIITCLNVYSHDVFRTNDKEVSMMSLSSHEKKCGCVIM